MGSRDDVVAAQVPREKLSIFDIVPAGGRPINGPLMLTGLVLVVASFQLNATMLSPAIADMAERLSTSPGVVGWSSTVFLAVAAGLAIFLPPWADKIGRKRAFYLSLAFMIVGTIVAMVAPNAAWLIVGRTLQGFCGATFALANLTLHSVLGSKKFGVYLGIVAACNAGVGGVDTLIGGLITDKWGFRGILAVILFIQIVALWMIYRYVPETRVNDAPPMDWAGALTMTGSLWALNMAITFGFGPQGWSHGLTWASLISAVILGLAFFVVEKRVLNPFLPLKSAARRETWSQLGTTFFTLASSFAILLFLVPSYSQDPAGLGMNSTTSAIAFLMPFSLLGWALAPLVGKFAPTIGYRFILRCGLAGTLIISGVMYFSWESRWALITLAFLMGATYAAMSNTVLNATGVLYSEPDRPGVLPGLNSAAFNMGASVGIGIMASVLVRASDGGAASGYTTALACGMVLAAIALAFSMFMPGHSSEGDRI